MTIKIRRSDLEKKSPAELAALVTKARELEEAQKAKTLDSYLETAHADQVDFHKAKKRIRLFVGGNRSGKTTGGSIETLWRALGRHPFRKDLKLPLKCAVVIQDFENHGKNILEPKLNQWTPSGALARAPDRNQTGAIRKIHYTSGSTLDVLSHDQELKVFEGSDYDFVWFDEPPPEAVFKAMWRGLTDRGGDCIITATPLTSKFMASEIKKAESGEDELRWFRYVDTHKNAKNIGEGDEALGKKRIEEFASIFDDPDEREARLSGKSVVLQGLIFKGWKPKHHLIPEFIWPHHWRIIESIDPHPHKPYGLSWIGVAENGAKILLRSGYFGGTIEDVASQILYERTQIPISGKLKPKIYKCLIDNYASVPMWQRSAFNNDPMARRISVREELENLIGPRAGGPRIEVAPKNVKGKIDIFKQWLRIDEKGKSRFYVFDTPENQSFTEEIEGYIWDTKKGKHAKGLKDQPVKEDDDIIDSVLQVALTIGKDLGQELDPEPISARTARTWKV